ncbi:MAG: DsbA family protein [Rickettsiales bacterium]|nr:DsbA family protein [Rickettsiales bacterium]
MRLLSALVLSLVIGTASAAYASPTAAVTGKSSVPTAEKFSEPNMRLPENSGGVSSSKLITEAPLENDYVLGQAAAPLVLIEYASMTCPHCAHFHSAVLPTLQKKYIDTGKMKYILRQFPLNEPALKATMLLYCVGEQNPDKYYVFTKVLFDAQNKWAFDSNYMAGLETIATVGGLSKDQFLNCTVNTEREMAALKRKKQSADELKIPHTPFIYVGGEAFDGERTPEAVSQFIDKKLAEMAAAKKP